MYPKYFGLKEPSFSITPDPQYLFLSEQHREALAHLLYGAGARGGFVLLSGEVGTGKTTVCRAFLEQLPEGVDVALVLNPAMTAVELMHAVCDEFGVEVPEGEVSVKVLVDYLNRFLLDAHARGRHPVLIIDEAQNLRPQVLEQIRLLTNLETSKRKLLQIFLIGQPELRRMLASDELRQLNQRITARFHLEPLSARETAAYVDHRIAVAGVVRPLFSAAALRRVHRFSGGVPRLINLICDRALLGAAVSRRMQVTPAIVDRAAREVRGSDGVPLPRGGRTLATAAALLVAVGVGFWLGASGTHSEIASLVQERLAVWRSGPKGPAGEIDPGPSGQAPAVASEGPGAAKKDLASAQAIAGDEAPVVVATVEMPAGDPAPADIAAGEDEGTAGDTAHTPAGQVEDAGKAPDVLPPPSDSAVEPPRIAAVRVPPHLQELGSGDLASVTLGQPEALRELLGYWKVSDQDAAAAGHSCESLGTAGLRCQRYQGRWSDLRRFDRPVALSLRLEDGTDGFVVIGHLDEEYAVVQRNGEPVRVPIAGLDERWSGDYLMLWRLPPSGLRYIGKGSSGEGVVWLRERLAGLPGQSLGDTTSPRFDAALAEAVRRFQEDNGLNVDGVAGPRTLVLLSNVTSPGDVPRLTQSP